MNLTATLLACATLAGTAAACDEASEPATARIASAQAIPAVPSTPAAPPTPAVACPPGPGTPRSFADLAAAANPAVVSVKTLVAHPGLGKGIIGQAEGSAFIYSSDGLILTNNHVVAHAAEIVIVIDERRELEAKVVGRDPPTDIAVLRVEASDLPYLPLGDSQGLRVGDWVIAIGNPFGLSHTVSAGIVSAKGRTGHDLRGLGDGTGYYDFIQTDASINPGNSGGPLLDLSGAVVGINTAIRAEANNIGFAIPIDMVEELLPRLVSDGGIRRSAVGITVSAASADDVSRLGLPGQPGALVRSVVPGGPGDKAGLVRDDFIVAFDGKPVPGPERLRWDVSLYGAGQEATMRVQRGQRAFDLRVRLGELTAP